MDVRQRLELCWTVLQTTDSTLHPAYDDYLDAKALFAISLSLCASSWSYPGIVDMLIKAASNFWIRIQNSSSALLAKEQYSP